MEKQLNLDSQQTKRGLPSTSVVAALLGLAGAVAVGGAVVGARRILRERVVVVVIQIAICDTESLT